MVGYWISLLALCATYYVLAILSVGIVYHRALTHRSLTLKRWFEYLMVTIALPSGTPIQFVGNHRFHHIHADNEHDPHSPAVHGFWYAHVGWYIPTKNMFVCILYALGGPMRMIFDAWNRPRTNLKYNYLARDIAQVPYYAFISNPWIYGLIVLFQVAFGVALFGYFWGVTGIIAWWLTLVVIFNLGDGLNSWCHLHGDQVEAAQGKATNNLLMSWLTMGDGWHANHHLFPSSAKLGLLDGQLDPTFRIIRVLESLGLARNIKVPSVQTVARKLNAKD